MRSCLTVFESGLLRAVALATALSTTQLVGCTGEIRKGTADDDATEQPDPELGADGAVEPGGSDPRDSGSEPNTDRDSGPASMERDARAPSGSPEAGTDVADANVNPGPGMTGGDAQVPDAGMPTSGKRTPLFVAVGYSGVRMVSRDLGKTWGNLVVSDTAGKNADDSHLLRSVRFGNGGVLVAIGWKIWTSTDAVNWMERTNPGQWMGGLQFANNLFVAAGGTGETLYSTDGIGWMKGGSLNGEPARTVAYGNNMFVAGTDAKNWWRTTNGKDWTVLSGGHKGSKVGWCGDKFADLEDSANPCTDPLARNLGRTVLGEGVYISAKGDFIERSENGKDWVNIKDTKQYPVTDVAFGYLDGI